MRTSYFSQNFPSAVMRVVFAFAGVTLFLVGCPSGNGLNPDGGDFVLTITVRPEQAGTVAVQPQKQTYAAGEQVNLTATAATGYRFDRWEGAAAGTDNPLAFTVNDDAAIEAIFVFSDDLEPEVSALAEVLPDEVSIRIGEDGVVELSGANVPDLFPGQVIISARHSLLARVHSVSLQDGKTILETDPAALTDVIKRAHIAINTQAMPPEAKSIIHSSKGLAGKFDFGFEDGGFVISLTDAELDLEDACKVKLTDGTFRFTPEFDFVLDIEDFAIQRFKCVTTGTMYLNMDVAVEATRIRDALKKEITLAEVNFGRGVFFVGIIPIEYVFFVSLKIGAKTTFGELGTVTAGFDLTTGLSAGAEYQAGRWTPIGDFSFDLNPHLPAVAISPVEAKVYIKPEFGIKFFEVVGPSISVEDYVKLVGDVRHEQPGVELSKGTAIDLNFEFKVPKIDVAKLSYSTTLWDNEYVMLARLAFDAEPFLAGDIEYSPDGIRGTDFFTYINPLTVTAVPDLGRAVAGYRIDYLCQDKTLTVPGAILENEPVNASKLFTAVIVPIEEGSDWEGSGNTGEVGPYIITTEVYPPDAGEVVLYPRKAGYKSGDRLFVQAKPEYGFVFHHWEGALRGKSVAEQYTVGGNATIRAVFASHPDIPRTLRVPQDYDTIQAALDAATYNDIVSLDFDTFSGEGNRDLNFHGRNVTLLGKGCENTIIDLGGTEADPHRLAELWDVEGTVQLVNLAIVNGYAGRSARVGNPNYCGGAVMVSERSSLYVFDCCFINCYAAIEGGAIWYDRQHSDADLNLTITGSRFVNCAAHQGGAVYLRNVNERLSVTVQIDNSTFADNTGVDGTATGSAFYCPNLYGNLTLANTSFNSNDYTAVVVYRPQTAEIIDCQFDANAGASIASALALEGALEETSYLLVRGCTFTNNVANNYAGAVTTGPVGHTRGLVAVEDCTFTGNSSRSAGAIYLAGDSIMRNCTFDSNSVTGNGNGGAASIAGTAENCTFTNNRTEGGDGGAVLLEPGGVLTECTFTGNTGGLWGGAVWIRMPLPSEQPGVVSACYFENNQAKGGGAIKSDGGVIRNSTIANNVALTHGGGGITARNTEILNCVIIDNTAVSNIPGNITVGYSGGGLDTYKCLISGCVIDGNVAEQRGGGIVDMDSIISGCVITDNTAAEGGGVWCVRSELWSNSIEGNSVDNCACRDNDTCCDGY